MKQKTNQKPAAEEQRVALISRMEACKYLGNIHLNTLDKLVKLGCFPRVVIGRKVYFKLTDLNEYIERQVQAS